MSAQTIIRRAAVALAAAAIAGMLLPAQAQTSSRGNAGANRVVRIVANGSDGDVTYYSVRCANGSKGDVRLEHEARKTCAVPEGNKTRCKAKWTIQAASEHVCAASGR